MEELVTVDEVGGEDDSIIEPDLPELEEYTSCPKESAEGEAVKEHLLPPTSSVEVQETSKEKSNQEKSCGDAGDQPETSVTEKAGNVLTAARLEEQKLTPVISEPPITNLNDFPNEEFKAALEETCLEGKDKVTNSGPLEEPMQNHIRVSEGSKTQEVGQVTETITNGAQDKDGILKKGTFHKRDYCRKNSRVTVFSCIKYLNLKSLNSTDFHIGSIKQLLALLCKMLFLFLYSLIKISFSLAICRISGMFKLLFYFPYSLNKLVSHRTRWTSGTVFLTSLGFCVLHLLIRIYC